MKLRYAAAAASLMALSPMAWAQTTQTKPDADKPSAAQPTQPKAEMDKEPSATQPGRPSTAKAPGGSMQPQWYSRQAGEMRASELIGTTVRNDAGDSIGDINEVVLSKDGKVAAVVIGVGGFLGIGEREVAVAFESLRLSMDNNQDPAVTLAADKQMLKSAPEWKWSDAGNRGTTNRDTTGTGSRPSTNPNK